MLRINRVAYPASSSWQCRFGNSEMKDAHVQFKRPILQFVDYSMENIGCALHNRRQHQQQ